MEHSISATQPGAVQVERLPGGAASAVWLRRNIEQLTVDDEAGGTYEQWECDELSFVVAGTPTAEDVESGFDALWEEHEHDGETDAERAARLAEDAQAQADYTAVLTDTVLPE